MSAELQVGSQGRRAMFVAGGAGVLLALLREKPTLAIDPGIFTSIFGGLRAGQRLYVDLFDTKDPLFFYSGTLMASLLGPRGLFVLDALLIVACAVIAALVARELELGPVAAGAAGVMTAGLVTNPATYVSGMTQLFAITLLLGAVLAALRDRMFIGGVLSALAVLFKLPMILFLPPLLLYAFLAHGPRRSSQALAGGLLAGGSVLGVVALRGELTGYFEALRVNLGYANIALEVFGSHGIPRGTGAFVFNSFQNPALLFPALWTATAAAIAVRTLVKSAGRIGLAESLKSEAFSVLVLGIMASTALYFILSAFFEHHLQLFALPASLGAMMVMKTVADARDPLRTVALPVAMAAIALWGLPADLAEIDELADRWVPLRSEVADAVEDIVGVIPEAQTVTVAMASETNEQGMLYFLDDGFEFACRYIFQLPWFSSDHYDEHLDCISAGTDIVVDFEPTARYTAGSPTYRAYRERLSSILEANYRLSGSVEMANGYLRVWERQLGG